MAQRLAKLSGVLVCLAIALAAFAAPGALAAETREPTGLSFGRDGVGGSEYFGVISGMAVDQSSGDIYVLDQAGLYKFNAAGEPSNFSSTGTNILPEAGVGGEGPGGNQVAVAPAGSPGGTAGDIYIAIGGGVRTVRVFGSDGTQLGSLGEKRVCGVATDPSGNVFIGSQGGEIRKYVPTGNPPRDSDLTQPEAEVEGTEGNYPVCNVAADGLGQVFAVGFNYNGGSLVRLSGLDDKNPTFGPSVSSPTVVPTNNHLVAASSYENEGIEFGPNGEKLLSFGYGLLHGVRGGSVAVNAAQDKVYVANGSFSEEKVIAFGGPVLVPDVTVTSPTNVKTQSATLQGVVNPRGLPVTGCKFELFSYYEANGAPVATVPCEGSLPTDENDHTVQAQVTGLSPTNKYVVRLTASNANGPFAAKGEFETLGVATLDPATNVTESSATLNGRVVPESETVTGCYFEYYLQSGSGPSTQVPCVGATPADDEVHPVSAAISGLAREATYTVRLVVKRASGESVSGELHFETAGAHSTMEFARRITPSEATLEAVINPRGSQTSYFFEYGTTTSYGQQTPTVTLGSAEKNEEIAEKLTGLLGGTVYHWRIVVTDSFGTVDHPDHEFTTQLPAPTVDGSCGNQEFRGGFAALLPDCRAYEQASPTDKKGGNVEGLAAYLRASGDGSRVTWYSQGVTGIPGDPGGHQELLAYLSSRGSGNWTSQRLMPPATTGIKANALGQTSNLRFGLYEGSDSYEDSETGLYLVDHSNGTVTTVVPPTEVPQGLYNFAFDGATPDGSHVFFETTLKLTPNAAANHDNLYGWSSGKGVFLVGVLPGPGEKAPNGGSVGGAYAWWTGCYECPEGGGALADQYVEAINAIAPSGDQVYFTANYTGQLYLRRGLDSGSPTTVRVSAPAPGVVESEQRPAAFQEATPDGKHAFFLSDERLTTDSTAEFESLELYRWNESSETLQDVTPAGPGGARVQGLLGASADGTSGYFVARSKLAEGAVQGEMNLYRFIEKQDGSFEYVFITALSPGTLTEAATNDTRNWSNTIGSIASYGGPPGKVSRVTPDGKTLLFSSIRSLTGYDNTTPADRWRPTGGEPAREIYRYSAASESFDCISCNPTGERPKLSAELQTPFIAAVFDPSAKEHAFMTHNLSNDGNRIFFQTPDPLVSSDINGRNSCRYYSAFLRNSPQCEDVYEWEAVNTPGGSCHKVEVNGGCLYLMSTGESPRPSNIIDSSADGKTVFIATTSQLVPQDQDQLIDAYAVTEGGGLASQFAAAQPKCSSGESCAGSAAAAPPPASRGSSTFAGPGNPKVQSQPPKCKKGKAKKQCKKHKKGGHGKSRTTNSKKSGGSK